MKRKKIFLWSVFAVGAICGGAVMIDGLLNKNFVAAATFWFFIYLGFVSVKYLLPKVEKKEIKITKGTKIFLWSIFALSSIFLGAVTIDFVLDKNFYAVTVHWVIISVGFVITNLATKTDKKENPHLTQV